MHFILGAIKMAKWIHNPLILVDAFWTIDHTFCNEIKSGLAQLHLIIAHISLACMVSRDFVRRDTDQVSSKLMGCFVNNNIAAR